VIIKEVKLHFGDSDAGTRDVEAEFGIAPNLSCDEGVFSISMRRRMSAASDIRSILRALVDELDAILKGFVRD
jgi:hypothetical protein